MSIFHKDIVPRLLQAEAQFSTLSLTGRIPGPRYEDFDAVIDRANKWLASKPDACLLSCEVVEVDGMYNPPTAADFEAQLVSMVPAHSGGDAGGDQSIGQGVPAFLRVLRMWYSQDVQGNHHNAGFPRELAYENVLPCRLESTPRAFGPKFQNLVETMSYMNRRMQEDEDFVCGEILSLQTCAVRFSSQHCSIDPDRMFWMAENPEDVHICYYFRIFYLRDMRSHNAGPRHRGYIGYIDFPPNYVWRGKRKREVQSDTYSDLVNRANQWLEESSSTHVINIQTLDHHSYFRCARDSPGQEGRVLDNPHFRSSLAGLMHYTKVLRLFFITTDRSRIRESTDGNCSEDSTNDSYNRMPKLDQNTNPPLNHLTSEVIASKVFHVEHCVSCEQVRLGSCHNFNQLPLAAHREVLSKINEWVAHNKVKLLCAETVKMTTSHTKSAYSANETHFQSCGQGSVYGLYAMRLYVTCQNPVDGRLTHTSIDFSPEPKTIRLTDTNCIII